MQLKKLEEVPFAHIIIHEYQYLCGRSVSGVSDLALPMLGEIIEESWQAAQMEVQLDFLQKSINERQHDLLGMRKEEFMEKGMDGRLPSHFTQNLSIYVIQDQVMTLLANNYMSYFDYEDNLIHSPIGDGIW